LRHVGTPQTNSDASAGEAGLLVEFDETSANIRSLLSNGAIVHPYVRTPRFAGTIVFSPTQAVSLRVHRAAMLEGLMLSLYARIQCLEQGAVADGIVVINRCISRPGRTGDRDAVGLAIGGDIAIF